MKRKEWRASLSVGVVLSNAQYNEYVSKSRSALVMVRKRVDGSWGVPAGHMDPNETSAQTAYRELLEETGITKDDIKLMGLPTIREIPGKEKTGIGIIYEAYMNKPLPDKGFAVKSQEIDWVRPVFSAELLEIEKNKGKGLFKPDYNLPIIIEFLNDVYYDPYLG